MISISTMKAPIMRLARLYNCAIIACEQARHTHTGPGLTEGLQPVMFVQNVGRRKASLLKNQLTTVIADFYRR